MRTPLALAALIALALVLPPGAAHAPDNCTPQRAFPSADGRTMPPGASVTYLVPAGQFITVTSAGPIDVTLVEFGTCAPTECDVHGSVGTVLCEAFRTSAVEVANRGEGGVLTILAIGICATAAMCELF